MNQRIAITATPSAAPDAPLLLRGDPVRAVERAAALGYDAVEFHVADAELFPVEQIVKACQTLHIVVSAIVTGKIFTQKHLCITSKDCEIRDAAMRELFAYIDLASRLRVSDGVVIGWVKGKRPEYDIANFESLLASQLKRLCDYAKLRGQKILLEVINRYETNLFNTAAELLSFLERFPLDNAYVHLDTFHMNIEEADMAAAIRLCGKRLGYFHVADSNRQYPGAGHIDFTDICDALTDVGYHGTLSVECISEPDAETAAARAIATLRSVGVSSNTEC